MGADAYWYFIPYDKDVGAALAALRRREFEAGRYSPVVPFIDFHDPSLLEIRPGPRHASIDAAVRAGTASAEGTRSILDAQRIAPQFEYGAAAPFSNAALESIFETLRPTHAMVLDKLAELLGDLERGQCGYLVVFEGDRPLELFFGGYSYD